MIYLPVPHACGPGSSYHTRIGWIGRTDTDKLSGDVSVTARFLIGKPSLMYSGRERVNAFRRVRPMVRGR